MLNLALNLTHIKSEQKRKNLHWVFFSPIKTATSEKKLRAPNFTKRVSFITMQNMLQNMESARAVGEDEKRRIRRFNSISSNYGLA